MRAANLTASDGDGHALPQKEYVLFLSNEFRQKNNSTRSRDRVACKRNMNYYVEDGYTGSLVCKILLQFHTHVHESTRLCLQRHSRWPFVFPKVFSSTRCDSPFFRSRVPLRSNCLTKRQRAQERARDRERVLDKLLNALSVYRNTSGQGHQTRNSPCKMCAPQNSSRFDHVFVICVYIPVPWKYLSCGRVPYTNKLPARCAPASRRIFIFHLLRKRH